MSGGPKAAKYLRGRDPLELVFTKRIGERNAALKAEKAVKKLPKSKKERLVSGVFSFHELIDF